MKIILESISDLERAEQFISWLHRPLVDRVEVSLSWLNPIEQQRSAKVLKFLFNDCGCEWGTLAFIITFIWYFSTVLSNNTLTWISSGTSLGFGIIAAVVAKFLGLAWSYWRLKAWFKRLKNGSFNKVKHSMSNQ